ncbi:MAG: AbiV family abortive infection protein [Asgard group archaeon]|nr:AbiV family abortive infection protein [Asgard group archaeon]
MKQKSQEFYLELAETCLANAVQFSKDAIVLCDNESFGHAYSLAVLGFEELAKTWIAFDLFLGISQDTDEIIELIQVDHITKQIYLWNMFGTFIRMEWLKVTKYAQEVTEISMKKNITEKEANRKIKKIIQKDCEDTDNENVADIASSLLQIEDVLGQLNANHKLMDNKKKKGFYVGFDINAQKITNDPLKFSNNPIFIETLNGLVNYTKIFITGLKENLDSPLIQKYILESRKIMDSIRSMDKSKEENEK